MAISHKLLLTGLTFLCLANVLLAQSTPSSLGCVQCQGYNHGECGLRDSLGQSPPPKLQQTCPLGTSYCYTFVEASPGQESYIRRGCGLLKCSRLPFGGRGNTCDDNDNVSVPSGQLNQSLVFSSGDARATVAVLQYCQGQLCNAGQVSDYTLPGYYPIRNAGTFPQAMLISYLILPILLALLY